MREVFRVPFCQAAPWYGPSAAPLSSLKPFDHHGNIITDDSSFLLGCVEHANNSDDDFSSRKCVMYLHGFPDQAVDHRQELPELYGQFSTRMAKKFAESFDCFAAITCSGSPGSDGGLAFRDKTVSQEVWDALNTMSYLSQEKKIGTSGFHLIGLSTGAIIGAVLRGLSHDIREALALPPILSITIIAACGCDVEKALYFDFDEKQISDFNTQGYCIKKFWLPVGSMSNPKDASVMMDKESSTNANVIVEQSDETRWCPHDMALGVQYKDDFLQLPIKEHIGKESSIPLLCIHGTMDKNVPIEEGQAIFAAAAEPKKYLEIPKGNHLLSNSKHLKKAISEIKKWHQECEQ
mmetsp:Transcript_24161/g.36546  ORF Transcript_24161/g.36546 Transcript_24161/m.36546 type:complete len:350 (+) Transcript_24161:147-1196(+)